MRIAYCVDANAAACGGFAEGERKFASLVPHFDQIQAPPLSQISVGPAGV